LLFLWLKRNRAPKSICTKAAPSRQLPGWLYLCLMVASVSNLWEAEPQRASLRTVLSSQPHNLICALQESNLILLRVKESAYHSPEFTAAFPSIFNPAQPYTVCSGPSALSDPQLSCAALSVVLSPQRASLHSSRQCQTLGKFQKVVSAFSLCVRRRTWLCSSLGVLCAWAGMHQSRILSIYWTFPDCGSRSPAEMEIRCVSGAV